MITSPSGTRSATSAARRDLRRPLVGGAAAWLFLGLMAPPAIPQEAAPAPQPAQDPAVTALRAGRYEEAINTYRQRTRVAQASSEDHRGLVRALLEVGRHAEAADSARLFIEAHPGSPELFNSLGETLWATGHLAEGEALFQQAIDGGASDRFTAELNLAVAAFERGRRAEAMDRFDRFIDIYNSGSAKSVEDLTAVAVACQYLGIADSALFQDALKAFDEAIEVDPGALRPRVLLGELFLGRYDSEQANPPLTDVLKVNPNHPTALLAMARRMEFDGVPEAADFAERALQTNPNLVAARVFRALQLLTLERFDDAEHQARLALQVNPASLDALSALAATQYLSGDAAAFEETRRQVLDLNPVHADLYNTLADRAVQNRLYGQAVSFAQEAIHLDPQSWRAYSILGLNQLRTGDIEEGRISLETSFAGDPFNPWVKNTLDLLDTFPDYVESATARFELMIAAEEADLLSLYLGLLAEEAYDYFAERYHHSPPTPIRIEVYPTHADFSVRTVGLTGLGALGVSFGPVIAIDSPSARPLGEFNWGSTVWHEIAHTFTLGATDFRIPRWFSEGLSVYEERRAREGWGDDASTSFLIAHLRNQLLPITSITDGFVRPRYPEQIVHAYYQASLICELIDRDWGFDAILGLLAAYKAGNSTEDAFRGVLGVELSEFDTRFAAYVEEIFAQPLAALRPAIEEPPDSPGAAFGAAPPTMRQLQAAADENPDDFLAQLSYGAALYGEDRLDEAVDYLERAKELFPFYAEANSPYWFLAMIARKQGNLGRAAEELRSLVRINEKHYQANIELASISEELGEFEDAAAALERTIYIYPLEIPMHETLAGLYGRIGDHGHAVRERRAVVALGPVDMAEALYQLASAQHAGGDTAAAKRSVLGALEIAPGFPAAQDLLLELIGQAGGGVS